MQLWTPKLCWYVVLERRGILLATFRNKSFTNHTNMNFYITMLTDACRVWNVALGIFANSLSTAWCDLGFDVLGHPLLRRLAIVAFFPGSCDEHPNAPNHQTAKTPAFIGVVLLADDQLNKSIRLAAPSSPYPLNSYGSRRKYLFFHTFLLHFDQVIFYYVIICKTLEFEGNILSFSQACISPLVEREIEKMSGEKKNSFQQMFGNQWTI